MRTLKDIKLSRQDRRAIQAAADVLRERFPVERVVLFGSKARGDDADESDIDLLVLTSRVMSYSEQHEITQSLFDLQMELGVVLSTLVISVEEWEHGVYQALPIQVEINRDGVAV